jgi:hypothetical protein
MPPMTELGLKVSELGVGGVTVSEPVAVVALAVAETFTAVLLPMAVVEAVNVAEVAPAATETLAGTLTTVLFALESDTARPPAGAAPVSVAVPVELRVPTTGEGEKLTLDGTGRATLSVPVRVTPP